VCEHACLLRSAGCCVACWCVFLLCCRCQYSKLWRSMASCHNQLDRCLVRPSSTLPVFALILVLVAEQKKRLKSLILSSSRGLCLSKSKPSSTSAPRRSKGTLVAYFGP